jgi:hypothetical protein
MLQGDSGGCAMTQSAAPDKIKTMTRATEYLVQLTDEDVRSLDEALATACALAERLEPNAVTASPQCGHSFDQDMTGFGVYAERTILQKQIHFS